MDHMLIGSQILRVVLSCCVCVLVSATTPVRSETLAQIVPKPSEEAVRDLAFRLVPDRAGEFIFETIAPDHDRDVFEIESRGANVVIRGNSGVTMATGLNWYLKHHCHCHVSLFGNQLDLPDPLPRVPGRIRTVTWAKDRYFLNYCCFGYSLPWWDWDQWERLVDWMALNGVNMPLAVTGQEAVWQGVCKRLGMTDEQIAGFLAGPPYLPFQWMGCLDSWGGPLPADWIGRHEVLQKKILSRQRELGMRPVLQGFTGHVPAALAKIHPDAKLHTIHWIEWETHLLDPLDPLFRKVARLYLEEQAKRFGTDHLYAADTFIEMTPPSGDEAYLQNLSRAIYAGMADSDPEAIWVLQGWAFMFRKTFWTQPRIRAFLDAIPDDRITLLDLFCEERPMWNQTEAFCGKPWLWCNIQSFGHRVRLGGELGRISGDLDAARRDPGRGRLSGLGFVNEGLDDNPVVYDLLFEMAWRDDPLDLDGWIGDYAVHRYGRSNRSTGQAWKLLADTVYAARNDTNSVITSMPTLGRIGKVPSYDNFQLAEAWRHLLAAADEFGGVDTYRYDLVNVSRQVLSNHAAVLLREVAAAYQAKDVPAFKMASRRFLQLIRDLDELLGTRREFLLGRWLEDAKRWGSTPGARARLEWNARRVLTLWGESPRIDDYACKQWSGMLSGYYLKRWEQFLRHLEEGLKRGAPADLKGFRAGLRPWMENWTDARETYPAEPQGDSVAVAGRLWAEYAAGFVPEAPSLTTGKPAICSHSLPANPARLANDGRRNDPNRHWATDVARHPNDAWWQVDLQEPETVGRVVVVGYFGDSRHYGFTVETSPDGRDWDLVADWRANKEPSTSEGHSCRFKPRPVRFIRVTQNHNSANTGRHLVEVMAYAE
jgi:alpha-N-acetylglucosaminidase